MKRLLALVLLTACGDVQNFPNIHNDSHDDNSDGTGGLSPAGPIPQVNDDATFEGYVSGAFPVTVDGAPYADMEAFYTAEQANLPAKVHAAGYDETWNVRLEAALGFADLWRDMTVFLSPVDDTGYQGQTRITEDGHFTIRIPAKGLDHDYRVRANKRISVILTRGEEQRRICYNFSAIERAVSFKRDSLPVALNSFSASVTAYDCVLLQEDGLPVPPT